MLKHLTSMFLSYHSPDYPVRLFSDRATALAWLKEGKAGSGVG
jgi:hypothetical protein